MHCSPRQIHRCSVHLSAKPETATRLYIRRKHDTLSQDLGSRQRRKRCDHHGIPCTSNWPFEALSMPYMPATHMDQPGVFAKTCVPKKVQSHTKSPVCAYGLRCLRRIWRQRKFSLQTKSPRSGVWAKRRVLTDPRRLCDQTGGDRMSELAAAHQSSFWRAGLVLTSALCAARVGAICARNIEQ